MKKREYKYLKADKWMSFFGGKPFKVPAKHYFMRKRTAAMTTAQHIRWQHQQIIQSELNAVTWAKETIGSFRIIWKMPEDNKPFLPAFVPPIDYWMPMPNIPLPPNGANATDPQ